MLAPTPPSCMADITLATNRVPAPPSSMADIMKDLTRPVPAASARPPLSQAARRRLRLTSNDPRMHEANWPTRTRTREEVLLLSGCSLPSRRTRSFDHQVDLDLGINGQVINRAKFANGSLDDCLLSPPIPYRPKHVSTPGGDIFPLPTPQRGGRGRSRSLTCDARLCV